MEIIKFYEKFHSRFNKRKMEFANSLGEEEITNKDWTIFMQDLLKNIFVDQKMNCMSQHKLGNQEKNEMKEFLNIDFSVFRNFELNYELEKISEWVTEYAIEHENSPTRIGYNIAKLLNLKATNKVFIGYTKKEEEKDEHFNKIIEEIENIREKKQSYFRSDEKFLLILGHYGMSKAKDYKNRLISLDSGEVKELKRKN